jgi:predicted RNase H-like HicB family nuclease
MNEYLVIYERAEDGAWGAHSPDLDGVFALAPTREEVEARMTEAIRARLQDLRDLGHAVSRRHTEAGYVSA